MVRGLDQALQILELPETRWQSSAISAVPDSLTPFSTPTPFTACTVGRLTYATGIKMARPDLKVIVVMGDGGLGIGGAHVLSSCRRNLDLTLLVLNNFNYGMTGGQCSATTPKAGRTSSGFLSELEAPLDICRVAVAAGAPYVDRTMATGRTLVDALAAGSCVIPVFP